MFNHELEKSGLAKKFKMSHTTDNPKLQPYIGKLVRYKRDLVAKRKFVKQNGTLCITALYRIVGTQRDWLNRERLRGYDVLTDVHQFGRVLNPDEIEIISE